MVMNLQIFESSKEMTSLFDSSMLGVFAPSSENSFAVLSACDLNRKRVQSGIYLLLLSAVAPLRNCLKFPFVILS